MSRDVFSFYRWSVPLFYDVMMKQLPIQSPTVWLCWDLHIENFGIFEWFDASRYFDINDFDEAWLGPVHRDLVRILSSIAVAGRHFWFSHRKIKSMLSDFIDQYCKVILRWKWNNIISKKNTARITDVIKKLPSKTELNLISSFVKHNQFIPSNCCIKIDSDLSNMIANALLWYAHGDGFFCVHDVAQYVIGNGSLWLRRYLVLVQDSSKSYHILDIKQSEVPVIAHYIPQPERLHQAQRIASIQQTMQYVSPLFLTTITIGGERYVMKELQASEYKINSATYSDVKFFKKMVLDMAFITARAHIKGCDMFGSDTFESLTQYAHECSQSYDALVDFAIYYDHVNESYYREFLSDLKYS